MDRGLLSQPPLGGARHGGAHLGGVRERTDDHRISRNRRGTRPPHPSARASPRANRRAPGAGPGARHDRRRFRGRDPRPVQGRRDRGRDGRHRQSLSVARSRFRSARFERRTGEGGGHIAAVGRGEAVPALPARRSHRIGQDRSLFRGNRGGNRRRPADDRFASRDRADRAVPDALRPALRMRAGRLAFGVAHLAAPPGVAGHRQRRGSGHGRRALGPVPALSEPRPDRRRRGARDQLQAGGRRPLSRARRRGDAGQVRGMPGGPRLGHSGDRDAPPGRARPLRGAQAAGPLRPRRASRYRGDRPDQGTARSRALAEPAPDPRDRRGTGARRAVAAVPQPPRLCPAHACAGIAATASNARTARRGWSSTG